MFYNLALFSPGISKMHDVEKLQQLLLDAVNDTEISGSKAFEIQRGKLLSIAFNFFISCVSNKTGIRPEFHAIAKNFMQAQPIYYIPPERNPLIHHVYGFMYSTAPRAQDQAYEEEFESILRGLINSLLEIANAEKTIKEKSAQAKEKRTKATKTVTFSEDTVFVRQRKLSVTDQNAWKSNLLAVLVCMYVMYYYVFCNIPLHTLSTPPANPKLKT